MFDSICSSDYFVSDFFFYFLNTILSGTVLSVFILLFGLFCLNSTYRLLLFVEIVELKMLMPISFNK